MPHKSDMADHANDPEAKSLEDAQEILWQLRRKRISSGIDEIYILLLHADCYLSKVSNEGGKPLDGSTTKLKKPRLISRLRKATR